MRQAAQVQYLRTEHEAVLGWVSSLLPLDADATGNLELNCSLRRQITSSFELYLATTPLLPHSAVVNAARAVIKFVAGKENELFLANAPSF